MCLAIPGKITQIDGLDAKIDYGGVSKLASLRFVEDAAVGDIVLVHAGFVIQKLEDEEGEELQRLVEETMQDV